MKFLNNWNPVNSLENLVYVAVTILFMNFFVVKPLRSDIHKLQKDIVMIAMQPRYSISNDFEKMRTKKNGQIVLDLNNELTHNEMDLMPMDTTAVDTVIEKQSFFKRIFGGKEK